MYCVLVGCCFVNHESAYDMRISDWSSDVCSSDLVLAVVQIFVIGEVGVLVVQFAVDRPGRAEELADADGAERSIVGHALGVLEVVADAAGDVPAVVELLRIGGLHAAAAGEQRDRKSTRLNSSH